MENITSVESLKAVQKDFLTAAEIATVLNSDPNTIRWQAHNEPDKLGFPVIVIKSRVKVPRMAFIKFCEGQALEGGIA